MFFLLPLLLPLPAHAAIFPFTVRTNVPRLHQRAPVPIDNTGNAQYVSNITIGGVSLPVLLDTGSSDLWVHFPGGSPSGLKDTGTSVTLNYAVGRAGGKVQTTKVQMGDMVVDDQVFLNVEDVSTFTSNIHSQGYDGLIGLGPNDGSVIYKKMDKASTSNTFLQRIFEQRKSQDNYITFLLDRKHDSSDPFKGQFSVSEIIPGFENVTSMPKLDVDTVNRLLKADQHWQALTDEDNGIIGPDGNAIKMKSLVPGAPKGQYVAVIDSGFTFSQVPRDVSDAIYGRVRGAYFDSENQWWLVPCGQYLNISVNFGGRNYPISPLDVVDDNFSRVDNTGKKVCIGAFQPITTAFSLLGNYDMILGMSFLRNVYTLLDFGKWIKTSNDREHPYIQMASITNSAVARADFIQTRLGGVDTISDSRWALLPPEEMVHSPVPPDEKKKRYQELVLSRWPYILVGCLAFVIIVTGLCIWKCCCRKKGNKASKGETKGGFLSGKFGNKGGDEHHRGLGGLGGKRDSYVPLEPKNQSAVDLRSPFTPESSQYNLNRPTPNTPYHQNDYRNSGFSHHSQYGNGPGPYAQSPQQQQYPPYHNQGYSEQSSYSGQGGYGQNSYPHGHGQHV